MATSTAVQQPTSSTETASLVVSLASMPREALEQVLGTLASAFPGENVLAVTPDAATGSPVPAASGAVRVAGYTPASPSPGSWTLVAADFLNAYELVERHRASAVLILGAEAQSLSPDTLRALAGPLFQPATDLPAVDLVVPRYDLPARTGLVNSAILYPISRALFGAIPRFPLAIDLGLSRRMAERLATVAQRFTASNQPEALIWPVAEAATGSCVVLQVEAGTRATPQPAGSDLNSILAHVAGSLFAEVDAKAAFWQRVRVAPAAPRPASVLHAEASAADEVRPMLESFRLAYSNLASIWSLVLPPQSLLGLKRLSAMPVESFAMPESLWARVVYDFLLAYRLRTLNRGHLLGALTPLYLAWVASHILQTGAGKDPELHIEATAQAFEADKPYLVSRWRWPDRFNP